MPLFGKKKTEVCYDKSRFTPVIRSSICTGEKVAGLRDNQTGRIEEIMLIQSEKDMEAFRSRYGITGPVETVY